MLTKEEIQHIALLARIGLSDAEFEKYQKDLSTVLAWVEALSKVETEDTEVIGNITGRSDVARSDVALKAPLAVREGIVQDFPESKDEFLKVKSVF